MPTLAFDNETKFSLLPLVEYGRTQDGKSRIGQLVSPNFVIQGKQSYYEHYHPGRTLIFQINFRFVLFENYSLSYSNLPVNQLHVPLTVITDTISVKDFVDINQAVTETHNGLTDLHLLIATIAQTAVDGDKLQQAISSLQASEVYDANFSVVTNSVRHFVRHTFLLALEELFTPFITIMVILIQILTTIWSLVFTLKCVKKYFPKFLACSRDILTVCFSTFLSIGKCFSVFHQSITTSNTDESSNHEDSSISDHVMLQSLENSGSRECFLRTNKI